MNIQSFNKKLQKIAALTDNMQAESQISALERDLLLNYIRELYDIALDDQPAPVKPVLKTVQQEVITPEVVTKVAEQSTPIQKTVVDEIVPFPVVAAEPAKIPEPLPVEVKKEEPPKITTVSPASSVSNTDDAIAEIFAEEKVTDLSDRLSLSKITDLTKSMGINERIFTQQELFGNDQTFFNNVLSTLNQFNNFEDAKQYLTDHVVSKYGWTTESKIKKAVTFVRHIKRKYN